MVAHACETSLGKLRQEDCESEAGLATDVVLSQPRVTQKDPVTNKTKSKREATCNSDFPDIIGSWVPGVWFPLIILLSKPHSRFCLHVLKGFVDNWIF